MMVGSQSFGTLLKTATEDNIKEKVAMFQQKAGPSSGASQMMG